ncbi:MAG: hypothetical protein QOI90_2763, partial [Mycobacterium sp.]|nr:hypothetical protein [Mycobacterium sp.]
LHLPGRHDHVEVLALTTGAGVRLHRPLEPAANSGALLWICLLSGHLNLSDR